MLALLGALLVAALAATGCVSMPTGGPVQPTPVSQGTNAQNQSSVQIQPQPPGANWGPQQIVEGFLTASASYGSYPQVADAYLTPEEQQSWNPSWSAVVYKTGPTPSAPVYPTAAKSPTRATVAITGTVQANLEYGTYSYSEPSSTQGDSADTESFSLVKLGGQWRISDAPGQLLLTSNAFGIDYQLRNLYFFDPLTKFLVPDQVYVPVRARPGVMDGLVNDLIAPPSDWLSGGATRTAFPKQTKVTSVTLDGVTPVVSLTGTAIGKAGNDVMAQISAQLLWTLSSVQSCSTGQGVQSVEVIVNGTQWIPPNGGDSAVQHTSQWHPACGQSRNFYYVASDGYLTSRSGAGSKPVAKIGTGYSQVAVSTDGRYLAALRGTTLYTGLVGGPLADRGTGFLAVSWDVNDNLWASASEGNQIVMFRSTRNPQQPLTAGVAAQVALSAPVTALQVAPDGVRVAMVMGSELNFGAIAKSQSPSQSLSITLSLVQETPPTQGQSSSVAAAFKSLTWYGSDNVIALSEPGPALTEYPVSGAPSPTPIQAVPGMQTIAASWGQPLVTSLSNGQLMSNPSPTGSWMGVSDGDTPAKGSSPIYPDNVNP